MAYKNVILCASLAAILLTGCSKVGSVFEKEKTPPLEGERLSVLELQKTLKPDATAQEQGGVMLPEAWTNGSWPQASGFPNHSMQNLSLNVEGMKNIWSSGIGTGSKKDLPLTAQPVVVGNTVFTLDSLSKVSAFNAQTGKRIWEKNIANENEDEDVITGGIAFAGRSLYATNGSSEILALNPENGDVLWRKNLPAPSRAAPTALGGRIFVSTLDNRIFALNAADGVSLWEYVGLGSTAGLLGAASPAANTDIVVPAFSSGEISALRVENGAVAWSDNLANVRNFGGGLDSLSDIKALPIIDSGLIIAMSFSGKIAAIEQSSGMRVWSRDIGGSTTPWVAGNTLFVLSEDSQLIALRIQDGAVLWVTELPKFENEKKHEDEIIWTAPLLANGKVLLAGSHGRIIIVDAKTGEINGEKNIKKKIIIPPVIVGETLYMLSEDGTLMAYK